MGSRNLHAWFGEVFFNKRYRSNTSIDNLSFCQVFRLVGCVIERRNTNSNGGISGEKTIFSKIAIRYFGRGKFGIL